MNGVGHPHEVVRAWSPDGTRLATAGPNCCRIWSPDSRVPLLELSHVPGVLALAWSPDGTRIATAGESEGIHIWDATTGEHLRNLLSDLAVLDLAWRADDTLQALTADGVASWRAGTGEFLGRTPPRSYPPHCADIRTVAWSPDGRWVASGAEDATVRIWDPELRLLRILEVPAGVRALAWHRDSRTLAAAAGSRVLIWDVTAWGPPRGIPTGRLRGIGWSPDGDHLLGWFDDAVVLATPVEGTLERFAVDGVLTAAHTARGPVVVTTRDTVVEVRDLHGNGLRSPILQSSPCAAAISPDGELVALTCHREAPRIWSLTGDDVAELTGVRHHWTQLTWHDDSTRLLLYGGPSPALLWDRAFATVATIPGEGLGRARSIAWHADRFVAANPRIGIEIHDRRGPIARTPDALWNTPKVTWHPDGDHLVVAVTQQDDRARHRVLAIDGDPTPGPDGIDVTTSRDGVIRFRDVTTGAQLAPQIEHFPDGEVVVRDPATNRITHATNAAARWLGHPGVSDPLLRLPVDETHWPTL